MKSSKKGLFIVFEGIDGSGKSTLIKALNRRLVAEGREVVIGQSFVFPRFFNWWLHKYPSSLKYYLGLAFKTKLQIDRQLKENKIVLQDRYVQSVDSFLPDCRWRRNVVFRKLLSRFFLIPDLYVWCTAEMEDILKRLKNSGVNLKTEEHEEYHQHLLANIELLSKRDQEYATIFKKLPSVNEEMNKVKKIKVSTSKNNN